MVGLLAGCAARKPERAVAAPSDPTPPALPAESPLAGQKFSLMNAKLKLLPDSLEAGKGGRSPVPLDTSDPRYAEYFAELKRLIEAKWSYPAEATRRGQSGRGEVRFVLRKDGGVRTVEIVRSSGVRILDAYIENAIRLAQPFPPIPASLTDESTPEDGMPITINFSYVLSTRPSSPAP
jgi:protein TonB